MAALRPPVPRIETSLRVRLIIGFLAVVSIALILVFVSVPRLLDGYFAKQSTDDLQTRVGQVQISVARELAGFAFGPTPKPIVMATNPPTIAADVREDFAPDSEFINDLLPIARADITIRIATDASHPDQIVYQSTAVFPNDLALAGQQRENLSRETTFSVPDSFWSQSPAGAPQRQVTVTLSNPFTYRAQTLEAIVGVMIIGALLALIAAVIISILIANRLARPDQAPHQRRQGTFRRAPRCARRTGRAAGGRRAHPGLQCHGRTVGELD